MTTKTLVVESEVETFNVDQSGEPAGAAGVDMDKLKAALADHAKAIRDREAFFKDLNGLRDRTAELDSAIMDIEAQMSDNPGADLDISQIKDFADEQSRLQNQISALVKIRASVEKQIKQADERVFTCSIQDSKSTIWRTLYDGLLSAVDRESLEKLFIAATMIGKPDMAVIRDLALSNDSRLFDAMIKQFGIPV